MVISTLLSSVRIFLKQMLHEFKIFVQMIGIKVKLHYALKSTLNSLPGEGYEPG